MNKLYEEKMIEMLKGGGCFVKTNVSLYRANKRITAEELGLEALPEKLLRKPSLDLLPEDICPEMKLIKSVENKVNALVNLNTFEFEGFGRYLKNSNSAEFANELSQLKLEFESLVDIFVQNYPDYIERSVSFWADYSGEFNIDRQTFRQAVRDSFVSEPALAKKFKFICTYLQIPDPARDAWKNCNEEYAQLSSDFLSMTMLQLRTEALRAMEDISESISSEKWNQKTLNKVPKLLERIEAMQLVPDEDLTSAIEKFKEDFITMEAKDYKSGDNDAALRNLQEGLRSAVSGLKVLASDDLAMAVENKLSGARKIKTPFDVVAEEEA